MSARGNRKVQSRGNLIQSLPGVNSALPQVRPRWSRSGRAGTKPAREHYCFGLARDSELLGQRAQPGHVDTRGHSAHRDARGSAAQTELADQLAGAII